jgi:hypothetical protein
VLFPERPLPRPNAFRHPGASAVGLSRATLRSGRYATASGPLPIPDARIGDGQAERQHPCCHTARRSVAWGWVAALPPLLVPAAFRPISHGGRNAPVSLRMMVASLRWRLSPSAPIGGTGEEREKGIAGLRNRSRWSLKRRRRCQRHAQAPDGHF